MKRDFVLSITFLIIGFVFLFSKCSQKEEIKIISATPLIVASKTPNMNPKVTQTPKIVKKQERTAIPKDFRTIPPDKNFVDVN